LEQTTTLKDWLGAFRLRTLPLALASIGMGSFLAASLHLFDLAIFIMSALTTIFLQILSNLANDYGDAVNGADNIGRRGPKRAVQSGSISVKSIKRGIAFFILLSFSSGLYLLYLAFGWNIQTFLFFLVLGCLAIVAAISYTMGRKPYGYMGLGDVAVLIFFGIVGVIGTFYLYTRTIAWVYILPATSCGFFSMAVLNLNNIRDIESDKIAGKMSIPVRIGRDRAVIYHWILLSGGIISAIIFTIINFNSYFQLLFLITLPLMFLNGKAVLQKEAADQLDPYLRQMAITTLLFVLFFGIGLLI